MPTIRLLLVEENKALRGALSRALQRAPEIEVVGTVGNVQGVIDRACALAPDVVLMDIHSQNGNVLDMARRLHPLLPDVNVVLLTDDEALMYAEAAEYSEMTIFLPKTASHRKLVHALQAACGAKRKER